MEERKTIVCCLPGLYFSNFWVNNFVSLLSYMQSKFNVRIHFGYSNNIYITRNKLLGELFEAEKLGVKMDYILWMDDDNILDANQLDLLVKGLESNSELSGIMGWYWLQANGAMIEPTVSCGLIEDDKVWPIKPKHMFSDPYLQSVEYGGFGAVLLKWEELKKLGNKSFAPIILPDSLYGFSGDDVSFFILAKQAGMKFAVDKRVKVPHLKLANADFDAERFIEIPEAIKPALNIQGWMSTSELTWLYEQASKVKSVIEIGSWKGRSSFALLSGCKGEVTCVDHWLGATDVVVNTGESLSDVAKKENIYAEFLKNVGHFSNLDVIKMDSVSASKELDEAEMVFIDAEHTFDFVVKDLEAWVPKATKLLCGHDVNRDDVRKALEYKGIKYQQGPGSIWFVNVAEAKTAMAA